MDDFETEALRLLAGRSPLSAAWLDEEGVRSWRPDLAAVESVVAFEIGDDIRTLWSHPLATEHPALMEGNFVHGPASLLVGAPTMRFGEIHIAPERQIPLINLRYPDGGLLIVANADEQTDLWVAGSTIGKSSATLSRFR